MKNTKRSGYKDKQISLKIGKPSLPTVGKIRKI